MASGASRARRQRARVEPAAMGSRLLSGLTDPPTTVTRAIFQRALMVDGSTGTIASTVITFTPANLAQQEGLQGAQSGTRFSELRVERVEAWGPGETTNGTDYDATALTLTLTAAESDNGSWVDYGVGGQARPHVAVEPNLQMRQHWYSTTGTTGLFTVSNGAVASGMVNGIIVVRVTMSMR